MIKIDEHDGAYEYSILSGGCGFVGRTAKKLDVDVGKEVKFRLSGGLLLIPDRTGKPQRTQFRLQWLAPAPPPLKDEYLNADRGRSTARPSERDDVDKRVTGLIEKILNRRTEQEAFAALEALGCPAVPAIIRQMDDRRRLPDPTIVLRNELADAFEATRFYAPEKVVDALAAILNQITGHSFGFIYNGATEGERTDTVSGWSNFLSSTPSSKLCEDRR
jgi:hypothetical protein